MQSVIRLPIALRKRRASSAKDPRQLTATGNKTWLDERLLYLADFLSAAAAAAFPAGNAFRDT